MTNIEDGNQEKCKEEQTEFTEKFRKAPLFREKPCGIVANDIVRTALVSSFPQCTQIHYTQKILWITENCGEYFQKVAGFDRL